MDFDSPLTNYDLLDIAEDIEIHGLEIYMKDEIKKIKNAIPYILNLDSSENEGTHWVALRKMNKIIYYFDPYGYPPPQEIIDLSLGESIIYSLKEVQHPDSILCGYFCIAFLYYVLSEEEFSEFLDLFSDDKHKNDKIIKKIYHDTEY